MTGFERVRGALLRLLRVPPDPSPPAGDPASIRVFRASPKFFRYRLLGWSWKQLGTLAGLLLGLLVLDLVGDRLPIEWLHTPMLVIEVVAWISFLAQIPFSLGALRLDYELRWYILSDRALRIREGILSVRERTMTFANIQQIGVRQGPVQRLLGIADVQVRTAGGGGSSSDDQSGMKDLHVGYFRGVEHAESIRDTIRDRVRRHRDAGLGDPGVSRSNEGPGADAVAAAREVLEELRTLRTALSG